MKFSIYSDKLLKALQKASPAIGNNSLVVLDGFKIVVRGDKLTITACNLETTVTTTVGVSDSEDGEVCLPAKIIMDHLKTIAPQPISFSIDKTFAIKLRTASGDYKLSGEDAENFPKSAKIESAKTIEITAPNLAGAIAQTLFCTMDDKGAAIRPAMGGVCFDMAEGLTLVATDSSRMAWLKMDQEVGGGDMFVLSRRALQILIGTLPLDDTKVSISYNDSKILFEFGDCVSCVLVDAKFPDYKSIIPNDDNRETLIINRNDFLRSLRAVGIYTSDVTKRVVLDISEEALSVSGFDVDFGRDGKESVKCSFSADKFSISLNGKILAEMIERIDGEDVRMTFKTPTQAVMITPISDQPGEKYQMLLMPLIIG